MAIEHGFYKPTDFGLISRALEAVNLLRLARRTKTDMSTLSIEEAKIAMAIMQELKQPRWKREIERRKKLKQRAKRKLRR